MATRFRWFQALLLLPIMMGAVSLAGCGKKSGDGTASDSRSASASDTKPSRLSDSKPDNGSDSKKGDDKQYRPEEAKQRLQSVINLLSETNPAMVVIFRFYPEVAFSKVREISDKVKARGVREVSFQVPEAGEDTSAKVVVERLTPSKKVAAVVEQLLDCGITKITVEVNELQGAWVATSIEVNGKPALADDIKRTRYTFKGEKLLVRGSKDDGREEECSFEADRDKSPKQLDITLGKKTLTGIYEVKGDQLKVCFENGGNPKNRPTKFATNKEEELVLMVFKRQKP